MNTNQKLTLGIAAIFMVTLTIVGVTYAYFVTRVTGETSESINIQAAQVGSVKYVKGNGDEDVIKMSNIKPGTVLYKSFSVENDAEDAGSYGSYTIFMESFPTASKAQFVHASSTDDCYKGTATQETTTCFDGTAYNNIYITLYEVSEDDFSKIEPSTYGDATLGSPIKEETQVVSKSGKEDTGHVAQDLSDLISIPGQGKKYYVLKVEYKDTESNQNIENEAELSLYVSIK